MKGGIKTDHATMVYGDSNDQELNMNPYPLIDLARVWFTAHALEQFYDLYGARVRRGFSPIELLSWSEENQAISLEWERKRLMRHENEEARYFAFERWRFVIIERGDILSVITFEEKYIPLNPKERWSRRKKGKKRRKNRRDAKYGI